MISRLFPALLLIIAVALYFGYISPTRAGSIAETKAQIASYESALEAAERFKQKENELIIAKAAIPTEDLARLEAFLPDGVNNVQIILDLNALAARAGLTLSDFDTGEGDNASEGTPPLSDGGAITDPVTGLPLAEGMPVDSLDMTITATGTYESFRSFLEGVESSLRLLDVVGVTVTDSETGVYTYEITTRLYWLR